MTRLFKINKTQKNTLHLKNLNHKNVKTEYLSFNFYFIKF